MKKLSILGAACYESLCLTKRISICSSTVQVTLLALFFPPKFYPTAEEEFEKETLRQQMHFNEFIQNEYLKPLHLNLLLQIK